MKVYASALAVTAMFMISTVQAAEAPGQWYVAPMASAIWPDDARIADDDFGAQISLGKAYENYNFEFSAWGYQLSGFNDDDMWGADIGAYRVWYRNRRITPFFGLALGYMKNNNTRIEDSQGAQSSFAFGLLTDLTSSQTIALRTEIRWRLDYSADSTEHDLIANVGLQIPFGGQPEPMAVVDPDRDGDGVPDSQDRCPGTPAGVYVDNFGCPLDADGDGVPDYLDKCPGTPPGTKVDASGCPLDSDGDGVLDGDDACPGTPAGARVDTRGCEIKTVIRLPEVEFQYNSATLTPASQATLNDAAATLVKNPGLKVEVAGYTDSAGADAYNLDLSDRRANSVRDYLISSGANPADLTAKGYGELDPIANNNTAEGRAKNRRVELRVLN
ncbi:MAG: OmpA family protein [Gammaproteobacteria bacterium]